MSALNITHEGRVVVAVGSMSSGTRLRKSGIRKETPVRPRPSLNQNFGLSDPVPGEKRLNNDQVYAIEHMFHSSAPVQAARTVLAGQLLSGGISLRKNGEDVELKSAFKEHLNDHWINFAGDVLDCFLKWGFVVVSYDEHVDEMRQAGLVAKRRHIQDVSRAGRAKEQASRTPPLIVPSVPLLGSYEMAYAQGGRAGYTRQYYVYSTAPGLSVQKDEETRVVVRQHPDQVGNIASPLASVFELGSFVGSLTELALIAEASRARPRVMTQQRTKDANALDPSNLFFDADSRAMQASGDSNENQAAVKALAFQQSLCNMINRIQTRIETPDNNAHSFSGGAGGSGKAPMPPPEVPPSIFTLPKDQELAPHATNPESRGDLEALSRLAMEQFSSALGVPADLIFTGRFSGNSTSQ